MKSEVTMTGGRLQITRVFAAPREVVFSWWSSAEKLRQWTGCKGATQCDVTMDFRPGGTFTQKMQIEGAGEFTLTGKYEEIVVPEKIVYQADMVQAVTRVTVEFVEQGNNTKVILTHEGLPSDFICQTVSQGTSESLDKLESMLERQPVPAS